MKRRHLLQLVPLTLLAACDRWRVSAPTIQQPTSIPRLLPTVGATATATQVGRWANRMAVSVMARRPTLLGRWHYELGFMMRAFELLWREGRYAPYLDYMLHNVGPLVDAEGRLSGYRQEDYNLDQIAGGRTLLFLYDRTGEERYLRAATRLREQLRAQPRTSEGGFWHKAIYPHQMWLDGLYMAAPFYAAWVRAFEPSAWDDIALQFSLVERHLRDQKTGLYYHGWDASRTQLWADPTTGRSPSFWGRSVGWLAMALVDVLEIMPADRPQRAQLAAMWRSLADALIDVQDPATGLWWQVLDQGGRAGNYHEASASCMFVYALARSARMGDLDEKHLAVARRGYEGIVSYLVQVDDRGLVNLNGICRMAGLGGDAGRDGSFAYYVSEPVVANDDKGVAAFILASVEIERVS